MAADRELPPLNIEAPLLRRSIELIDAQNAVLAQEPGRPQVEVVHTRAQWRAAAAVMAQAFVQNKDRGWLAWLPPHSVRRLLAGDGADAERRIGRVIAYLFDEARISGGLLNIETAEVGPQGQRVVRGAAVRRLPMAVPREEGLLHKYVVGGLAALQSYGLVRALAADQAYVALKQATDRARAAHGTPERCIYTLMACVVPAHQETRVTSRLTAPFRQVADEFDLPVCIQSSAPEDNDERVFRRYGFERIGEHRYGESRFNNVGPFTINLLVRNPRPAIEAALRREARAAA